MQPADPKKLDELHLMASELLANGSGLDAQTIRQRMAAAISGGYDFADTLHNVYLDFGYPGTLSFSNFWNMYRRFGIASNVVELPVDAGWMTEPKIESGNTQMLNELKRLDERINLWNRMKGLDTRQRVGRYAGMFMRVKDNQMPSAPLDKQASEASLFEMMPLYESQLKVVETDNDPRSERYGQPNMLEYSQDAPGSRNEKANQIIKIHYTRIVFAAEGADTGWIYGIPALENVYNSLMDLRKVIGGAGEGFYKNAAQNIVFDLKDPASAQSYKDKLDAFSEQYDDFSANRMRRGMWTPGMEAKVLQSTMTNPKEPFNVALNDVAAGSKIPATILIGQQTGRLASDEDSKQFLAMVQSRRENFCTPGIVRPIIDWCQAYGILPAADYTVEWDDLLARSDEEKLGNATSMAEINERQFKSGGEIPFNGREIREAAGFDPLEEVEPGDENIDDDEDELP